MEAKHKKAIVWLGVALVILLIGIWLYLRGRGGGQQLVQSNPGDTTLLPSGYTSATAPFSAGPGGSYGVTPIANNFDPGDPSNFVPTPPFNPSVPTIQTVTNNYTTTVTPYNGPVYVDQTGHTFGNLTAATGAIATSQGNFADAHDLNVYYNGIYDRNATYDVEASVAAGHPVLKSEVEAQNKAAIAAGYDPKTGKYPTASNTVLTSTSSDLSTPATSTQSTAPNKTGTTGGSLEQPKANLPVPKDLTNSNLTVS